MRSSCFVEVLKKLWGLQSNEIVRNGLQILWLLRRMSGGQYNKVGACDSRLGSVVPIPIRGSVGGCKAKCSQWRKVMGESVRRGDGMEDLDERRSKVRVVCGSKK